MSGLISGFIAGAAGFGAQQLERSLIQDALRERDERLAEIAKEGQRYGSELATQRETATEGRAEARRKELGEAVTKARTGQVDDLSGTVRDKTPREAMEAERDVYAGRGLVNERLQTEQLIQRDDEGRDRRLDRTADNQRADRQLEITQAHYKATEANQAATNARLMALTKIQVEAAKFDLDTKKQIDVERKAMLNPDLSPEEQTKAERRYLMLLGKAKEVPPQVQQYFKSVDAEIAEIRKMERSLAEANQPLPKDAKSRLDELHRQMSVFGQTGRLDIAAGGNGNFPQPSADDIKGLQARANNPAAAKFFDERFGPGASAKFLKQDSAAQPPAQVAKPTEDRTVTVPGMGMMKKSEIPAHVERFQSLIAEAQRTGNTQEMVRLGNIVQGLKAAQDSPGI